MLQEFMPSIMNNYPEPPLPQWGKNDRGLFKQRAQVKSRFYYIFWGVATVSVVLGQLYVGSGYRTYARSLNRLFDTIEIEVGKEYNGRTYY